MSRRLAVWNGITRDIAATLFGRAGASVLRLVTAVVLARVLRAEDYGLAAVLLNSGLLLSTTLEFGLGASYIQQEALSPPKQQEHRFSQLFLGRLCLWFVLLVVAALVYGVTHRVSLLSIAVLVYGTGQNLCNSTLLHYQVRQDFRGYARVGLQMAALQLVWVGAAGIAYALRPYPLKGLLFLIALSGWAPLPLLLSPLPLQIPPPFLRSWREDVRYLLRLLPFGKWVGLSSIAVQAFSRYGVLLLGSQAALAEAARYDVAMSVGRSINLLAQSTAAALFPRFAQLQGPEHARRWLPSILRNGGLVVGLGLCLYYLLGRWMVPILFGSGYRSSVIYLDILMPGLLLPLLAEVVVGVVTFTLSSPASVFWVRMAKLLAFLASGHWLLAHYAVRGLAAAQTLLALGETVAILAFAFWAARKKQR
ncbi:MAG: oligosaccharide flippase family protein [candidate division KSB1 bacterium]|nr:oligosaccharide flippase family protein [candidate division KSB1 bacterium]